MAEQMIDQEMASIIRFTLENANDPTPYYWYVKADFAVPSAYFPPPEVRTEGDTTATYAVDRTWYIKMFHRTPQEAYALAFKVANAIRAERNLIPLIDPDGHIVAREWVRVNDPTVRDISEDGGIGVAQLGVTWRSHLPYNRDAALKMQTYDVNMFLKKSR